MATRFGITLPLWNFSTEPGNLLERAVGEIGVDHVTVPAVGPALAQFRYFVNRESPYFHTDGGWHFPPETKRYAGSIRPKVADWCGHRDALKAFADAARTAKIGVRCELDVRFLGRYLDAQPQLRIRNAFDDELRDVYPCLSSADARESIRATLDDLLRYQPLEMQLCNWKRAQFGGDTAPMPLLNNSRARRLSVLCFCAACRQIAIAAELDPDAVARSVRVELERAITASDDGEDAAPAWRDDQITRFETARRADERRWLAGLARQEGMCPLYQVEWLAAAGVAPPEGWRTMLYVPPLFAAEQSVAQMLESRGAREPEPHGLILPVVRATFPEAKDLVQTVVKAAQAGYALIDFALLDEAPAELMTWVRQAVRYARRG